MNEIRQYRPAFVEGFENATVPFETKEELLAIPFVANFAAEHEPVVLRNVLTGEVADARYQPTPAEAFHRFSISPQSKPTYPLSKEQDDRWAHMILMAEYGEGRTWWVVGFIRDPLPAGFLPTWEPPKRDVKC